MEDTAGTPPATQEDDLKSMIILAGYFTDLYTETGSPAFLHMARDMLLDADGRNPAPDLMWTISDEEKDNRKLLMNLFDCESADCDGHEVARSCEVCLTPILDDPKQAYLYQTNR